MSLSVVVIFVVVAVLALLVGWHWFARIPLDQSVSESWLTINGRDQGKGGSR